MRTLSRGWEQLEDRQLLASDLGTVLLTANSIDKSDVAPLLEPFRAGAVTLDSMLARAQSRASVPGELIVAVSTSAAARSPVSLNWTDLIGARLDTEPKSLAVMADAANQGTVELVHLDLDNATDLVAAVSAAWNIPNVLWATPNFVHEGSDPRELIPNDPQYGSQYHHPLMQNHLAWDTTLGSPAIRIGVTDDGVSLAHVDMAANIWVNAGEIPANGIDDDANGRIDDVNGWDFVSNDNNPNHNGSDSHGSHVAGIAAARTNNAVGVAGTAGGSTIMPLKFYGSGITWTSTMIFNAFKYGTDNGAKIITTSYNMDGWVGDPTVISGYNYMHSNGVLHFNSAGNNNSLNPLRQAFEQTLLVASTNSSDVRSSFSNYGTGVDLAAPGENIFSTLPGNTYGNNSGTSMSTPNAAGVAALIWSAHPTWTRDQVAAQIRATVDNIDAQNPSFVGLLGGGRVNSFKAVTQTIAAPRVGSLIGIPASTVPPLTVLSNFRVRYNQVMDGASVTNVANYDLRGAGVDNVFDTTDDVVFGLSIPNGYFVGTNEQLINVAGGTLTRGEYRLTIRSGGTQNPFATPLDGNGNGTGGDDFVAFFSAGINEFVRMDTLGSLAAQSLGNPGNLASSASEEVVPFFAEQGETIAAVVTPQNPAATLSVQLLNGTTYTASGPGQPAILPLTAIAASGTVDIRVTGNAGTTFSLDVYRNVDIAGLQDTGAPVSIDGSFLPLGSGRWGAVGRASGSTGGLTFSKYSNSSLFVDISTTGTPLNLTDDSEATINTTVGNPLFPAGSVTVSNNGAILAGGGRDLTWTNANLPTSLHNAGLFPFWDDIDDERGNVYWRETTIGGIPALIVQWHNRPHYDPAGGVGEATFQIQLFAGGSVAARYVYPDVDFGNAAYNNAVSATVGYQTSGTVGSAFSFNTASLANNDVLDISFGVPTVDQDDFQVDLSSRVGNSIDAVLDGLDQSMIGQTLELLDSNNVVVATSVIGSNFDRGIKDYVVASGGIHTFRVSTNLATRYNLTITDDLVFDTESNDIVGATLRTLDNVNGALGYLLATGPDYYRIDLDAGEAITFETDTPFDNSSRRPLNALDPRLVVTDGASTVLASDTNSLDGKNARIAFAAPTAGTYYVGVISEAGLGEYVLSAIRDNVIDGDFDDNGQYNCLDINALTTAVATGGSVALFDLTGDNQLSILDVDAWRLEAGEANIGAGRAYRPADANLDGVVDGTDFGLWNTHKFTSNTNWCEGNFNADLVVDGTDFGIWNSNNFTSSDVGRAATPAAFAPQAASSIVVTSADFRVTMGTMSQAKFVASAVTPRGDGQVAVTGAERRVDQVFSQFGAQEESRRRQAKSTSPGALDRLFAIA